MKFKGQVVIAILWLQLLGGKDEKKMLGCGSVVEQLAVLDQCGEICELEVHCNVCVFVLVVPMPQAMRVLVPCSLVRV